MTEQHPSNEDPPPEQDRGEGPPQTAGQPVQRTGNDAVDSVLRSLEDLDETPLEEHPGAFERAHDALRGALSDARERPAEPADQAGDEG